MSLSRVLRNSVGFKCRMVAHKFELYDPSPYGIVQIDGQNSFHFVTPCEFDLIAMHIFIKDFPYDFLGDDKETDNIDTQNEYSDVARNIDLGESEVRDDNDKLEINFSPRNVTRMKWLADVDVSFSIGYSVMYSNRLSMLESYWLFKLQHCKNIEPFIKKFNNIADLCVLSKMGFSTLLVDAQRRARHLLSNERVSINISSRIPMPPGSNIELEIVFEGRLYTGVA